MEMVYQTPSQTIGPFFAFSLTSEQYGYGFNSIIMSSAPIEELEGEPIVITGNILDGEYKPIPDAIIELVSEHPFKKQNQKTKTLLLRQGTGTLADHRFSFNTVKPFGKNGEAPHVHVILFMRGSLRHLHTRMYFSDEANEKDKFLISVAPSRRNTLLAQRKENKGQTEYHFNIYLQGENETVFFDL